MKLIKNQLSCERCSSTDVIFDTTGVWNFRFQKFEYDIFDSYCNDCNDSCRITETPIENELLRNVDVL